MSRRLVRLRSPTRNAVTGFVLGFSWAFPALTTVVTVAAAEEADLLYRIRPGDEIEVRVFDEPDLSGRHRVDSSGEVRLALIGTADLAGMTPREAEDRIEFLYVENRILRKPMVAVRVTSYAVREVTVIGQVRNQGTLEFPPEVNAMDLVDVIAKCGGFTSRAGSSSVAIVRIGPNGEEIKTVVDVDARLRGRSSDSGLVVVFPGDKIVVPRAGR